MDIYTIKDYPSATYAAYTRKKIYSKISPRIKTIAIYKSSGALGDFVQAIPLFRNFKTMFPQAKIVYLGSYQTAHCATIFKNIPYINEFVEYYRPGKQWSFKQYRNFLKKYFRAFDLIVDTQGKFIPTFYLWLLNPRYLVTINFLFSNWPFIPQSKGPVHVVAKMNFLARVLGLEQISFSPAIKIAPEYRSLAQNYLQKFKGPFIAIIPGAGHSYKMWPKEKFAQLADRCVEMGFSPILIGAHAEKDLLVEIASLMRQKPIIPIVDEPRFGQDPIYGVGLFQAATATVGNDCGGLHLATLAGSPVIGIYGPTSPVKSGPLGDHNIIISKKFPCSPCKWFRQQCPIDRQCLKDIAVDEVVQAIKYLTKTK